uniref:Putative secreted protein n=1 Tax=Ixodes ricinus TaxID=34613 RepID=A0A6B0UTK2_IXORI
MVAVLIPATRLPMALLSVFAIPPTRLQTRAGCVFLRMFPATTLSLPVAMASASLVCGPVTGTTTAATTPTKTSRFALSTRAAPQSSGVETGAVSSRPGSVTMKTTAATALTRKIASTHPVQTESSRVQTFVAFQRHNCATE